MKKFLTYLILALMGSCLSFSAIAEEAEIDDGYSEHGRLVVSPTLIEICGLSSKKPTITEECYKKLAEHLKKGETGVSDYPTYEAERSAILNDYAKAYLKEASIEMIASGALKDELDKKVGKDPTAGITLDKDRRQTIENNNNIADFNTRRILLSTAMRSQAIKAQNIKQILRVHIPAMAEEIKDETSEDASDDQGGGDE